MASNQANLAKKKQSWRRLGLIGGGGGSSRRT